MAPHSLQGDQCRSSSRKQTGEDASAAVIWQPTSEDAACKLAERQGAQTLACDGSCKHAAQVPTEGCATSLSDLATESNPVARQPRSSMPRVNMECIKLPASSPAAVACVPTAVPKDILTEQGNRTKVANVHDSAQNTQQKTSDGCRVVTIIAKKWGNGTTQQGGHAPLATAVPSKEVAAAVALAIRDLWSMLSTFDRLELASTFAGTSHMSQDIYEIGSVSPDLNTIRCYYNSFPWKHVDQALLKRASAA